ncbi:hypothetical protein [Sorangium sp. So ce406]|uniref:hypothetical protein n=1 Tax=Sorangium sp. So ce406 TaxID=3133311 RepID=UPI003F5B65EE
MNHVEELGSDAQGLGETINATDEERVRSAREAIQQAIRGAPKLEQKGKAFDVRASGARLDAEVAVFLKHRRYTGKKTATGAWEYIDGVELRPRNAPAERIINWPEQHYDRGIAKNEATNRRFKRMVRIFKRLRADMAVQGDTEQQSAAGQVRRGPLAWYGLAGSRTILGEAAVAKVLREGARRTSIVPQHRVSPTITAARSAAAKPSSSVPRTTSPHRHR